MSELAVDGDEITRSKRNLSFDLVLTVLALVGFGSLLAFFLVIWIGLVASKERLFGSGFTFLAVLTTYPLLAILICAGSLIARHRLGVRLQSGIWLRLSKIRSAVAWLALAILVIHAAFLPFAPELIYVDPLTGHAIPPRSAQWWLDLTGGLELGAFAAGLIAVPRWQALLAIAGTAIIVFITVVIPGIAA